MGRTVKTPNDSKKVGSIVVDFDYIRRIVYYRYWMAGKIESRLMEVEVDPTIFEITFQTKNPTTHQWKDKFNFQIDKRMYEIGKDKRSDAFRFLLEKFEDYGAYPEMPGSSGAEKLKSLATYLGMSKHTVKTITSSKEWGTWENEHPDEVPEKDPKPKKTWAEATGHHEEFTNETFEESKKILERKFLKIYGRQHRKSGSRAER